LILQKQEYKLIPGRHYLFIHYSTFVYWNIHTGSAYRESRHSTYRTFLRLALYSRAICYM